MRTYLSLFFIFVLVSVTKAQDFDKFFCDSTLRIDYIFAGNAETQHIYLSELIKHDHWAGRKHNLNKIALQGNGQIIVKDHATGDTIYTWTFSTLFQEWLQYDEAKQVDKAFQASYNIPLPKNPVDVTVTLTNNHDKVTAEMSHFIDPKDILIRRMNNNSIPFHYVWKGKGTTTGESTEEKSESKSFTNRTYKATPFNEYDGVNITGCVDLAIVADGYTESEMGKFYMDCERAVDALFAWEPLHSLKDRFNVVAVAATSQQSGPSTPHLGIWNSGTTNCHYDTFYSDRYLMSQDMHRIYDLLSDIPFEHIMVLVNSDTYGGGGIYNQITFATSDHPTFRQVFVHEFGHSYGGLGDEYAYDDMDTEWYPADTEPWEPNLTTLRNFQSKWADLMPKNQSIPTPLDTKVPNFKTMDRTDAKQMAKLNACTQVVGVFEGAGYQSKGCYRPAQECRMKINEVQDFCPVCSRAIRNITDFYTK